MGFGGALGVSGTVISESRVKGAKERDVGGGGGGFAVEEGLEAGEVSVEGVNGYGNV